MRKLKSLPILSIIPLLFSCGGDVRVEYKSTNNLENGNLQVTASAIENKKHIILDTYDYTITYLRDSFEITFPEEMDFYSSTYKETYSWPVIQMGASTGSPLYYPFYVAFYVPTLEEGKIDITVNIGKNMSKIYMDEEDSFIFINTSGGKKTPVKMDYKVTYKVAENNPSLISDEDGKIFGKNDDGSKGKIKPIDYGNRVETTEEDK